MCQCPPKCEKCHKAATIYRSTIHVLHNSPQHSCTISTNSGLWSVVNSIPSASTHPTGGTNAEFVKRIKEEPIPQAPFIGAQKRTHTEPPGGEGTSTECTKRVKEPISNTQPLTPLMSLTIRRERKKARAKEKKNKKQNDLRLLLEKKNTQKHSYHEVNIFIVLKICANMC